MNQLEQEAVSFHHDVVCVDPHVSASDVDWYEMRLTVQATRRQVLK